MSLREDKTSNILKNYTNLVNRLKQSQKERDQYPHDYNSEDMPFATEELPQQPLDLHREKSEFQQTQQLPFRMSQDHQQIPQANFFNNTAQDLRQYLRNQQKLELPDEMDENGRHQEEYHLGIKQQISHDKSNRNMIAANGCYNMDQKAQDIITPLPMRMQENAPNNFE